MCSCVWLDFPAKDSYYGFPFHKVRSTCVTVTFSGQAVEKESLVFVTYDDW